MIASKDWEALSEIEAINMRAALGFTHILQDSFSPAHTERSGPSLRVISSIYSYGQRIEGVCYHEAADIRDRIWKNTLACSLDANNRSFSCLKAEAQQAAVATGGYLRLIGEAFYAGQDLEQMLLQFFLDRSADDSGFLNCDDL